MKKKVWCFMLAALFAFCGAGCAKEGKQHSEHNYGDGKPCEDRVCVECGKVLPASAEHTFSAWQDDISATCVVGGLRYRQCSVCGKREYETVPRVAGHDFGADGVCTVCGFDPNGKAGAVLPFGNAKITVSGNAGKIVGEALEISGAGKTVKVSYSDPSFAQLSAGDAVNLNFALKIDGKVGKYSKNVKLVSSEGRIVDYAYPEGEKSRATTDAKIVERHGEKWAEFILNGMSGQTVALSDFSVDTDAVTLNNLFGGVELIQFQSSSALMQCHIIVTPQGKVCVIDGGSDGGGAAAAYEAFCDYMIENGWTTVDHWFLTHYHSDHASVIKWLLHDDKNIRIKNLYYDFPTADHVAQYDSASEAAHVREFFSRVEADKAKGEGRTIGNVVTPHKGDEIVVDPTLTFKVLNNAYFQSTGNMGNDSSVLYKMETPGRNALFLGDMSYLHENALLADLSFVREIETCSVVQLGHHGQAGCSENFYKKCSAMKVALFCAAQWIFDARASSADEFGSAAGIETMKTRRWMRSLGVPYCLGGDEIFVLQ